MYKEAVVNFEMTYQTYENHHLSVVASRIRRLGYPQQVSRVEDAAGVAARGVFGEERKAVEYLAVSEDQVAAHETQGWRFWSPPIPALDSDRSSECGCGGHSQPVSRVHDLYRASS
ncbi:hypothetical protein HJFPF1_11960 [Paramyrothecium foliicola]|nr:hypothetical protein HJFPF1_11960 [Paramyrothecium foliicola]